MASVGEQLAHAQQQDLSLPDVRVLLAAVLQKSKAWLYAYPEYTLTASEQAFFAEKLAALQAGYPLPYLLGEWEFYCLPFNVSPAVLIPRPETELLVETALNWAANRSPKLPLRFGDVGTGSGCIAVTLAYHLPHAQGWAIDIAPGACAIAQANANRHQVATRLQVLPGNLLQHVPFSVDLLCANLPYIAPDELSTLAVAQHEPLLALAGGQSDGLQLVRELLAQLPNNVLHPQALVLLEIGAQQGHAALQAAQNTCPQAAWQIIPDLAGHDRLLRGDFP